MPLDYTIFPRLANFTSLNIKDRDSASENLHKKFACHQGEGCLILNFIVRECKSLFQLLTSKEEALLVWWNSFHFWEYRF